MGWTVNVSIIILVKDFKYGKIYAMKTIFTYMLPYRKESQIPTQRYGRRPFGVGLLVAGYDVSEIKYLNSF